ALRLSRRGQEEAGEALRSWLQGGGDRKPSDEARHRAKRFGIDVASKTLTLYFSTRAMRSLDPLETWEYRVAQGVGTGPVGVYNGPCGFYRGRDEAMRPLEIALLAFGGMRQAATVFRTASGADLPIPMVDDTGNIGALVAENTTQTEQGVTFTQLVLNSFKYTSKYVLVSVELLQDSAVNIPEMLGRLLGERIGRITNLHFPTGDGVNKPRGVVTAATLGVTGAV